MDLVQCCQMSGARQNFSPVQPVKISSNRRTTVQKKEDGDIFFIKNATFSPRGLLRHCKKLCAPSFLTPNISCGAEEYVNPDIIRQRIYQAFVGY